MDEFKNTLDPHKFRATNARWNELRLNDPWSVGYVSTLIESEPFSSKEQWEEFYYNSGATRNVLLKKYPIIIQNKLNDCLLKYYHAREIDQLGRELKNLNFQYGRTREQLAEKADILYKNMDKKSIICLEDCIEAVRYRTICETWNGIILRERNTIVHLKRIFPNIEFRKTNGTFDHKYAVDYELYHGAGLICGIQIKPESYTKNVPYVSKARNANKSKNILYRNNFASNVFDIIARKNGTIVNQKVLNTIQTEISGKINLPMFKKK